MKQDRQLQAHPDLGRHGDCLARPPGPLGLHPGALRRVLALAEGRRPVHRRPPRRGGLPDGRGARPPGQHLLEHGRALLAGARVRGLPRAPAGRARRVPPTAAGRDRRHRRPPAPLFSLDHTEFEAALAADHVNVEDTAHKLSRSDVEAAIDAIVSAEKVLIAGTDQMAFFASYLRHLLMLLDLRAEIVASPSQEALGRLSRIDERDARRSASRPDARIR